MALHRFDLTPLFRNTVGFDRFSDLFDMALRGEESAPAYPPYNIEKLNEDDYRIVLAVAGFKDEDLNITAQNGQLTISGRVQETSEKQTANYLHKGIGTRAFERKFSLADHVDVTAAELKDGLLTVTLHREIPEAAKPRMIAINGRGRIDAKKAH